MTAALLSASLLAVAALPGPASADPKPVTFSLSDQMRVSYFWLYVPELKGYWQKDDLKVTIDSVGGSLEALQQVAAGNAQFGQMGTDAVIKVNVKESIPAQVALLNGVFQWALGVPDDSPIKSAKDLKGKTVGVYSLSTNGNSFLKAYIKSEGLDPETDVNFVAVGFGGPALHALQTGQVDALYFWDSAFVAYENQGSHFRYLRSEDWVKYPDYAVATLKTVVDADPAMVEAFVRGMVEGIVFTEANPACAVKLFWKAYPDAKPTGVSDEVALDNDLKFLKAQMREGELGREATGGDNWGVITPTNIADLQTFLNDAGDVQGSADPEKMIVSIPGFFDKVNDFDKKAIEEDAKQCKL
jgi:NitT/TauT family transport system substrate-binding protein